MTFDSVCKYSEQSIQQCRELLNWIKKRQQIEQDYALALKKLNSKPPNGTPGQIGATKKTQWRSFSDIMGSGDNLSSDVASTNNEQSNVHNHLMETNLWSAFNEICNSAENEARSHRLFADKLGISVLEPLQKSIRDMENARKALVEDGNRFTRELQETYTNLKKAKQYYDEAQATANEAQAVVQKYASQPASKVKDVEKATTKAQQAQEKAQQAQELLRQCEEMCRVLQEKYYSQLMPDILERFRQREYDRSNEAFTMMTQYCQLSKLDTEARFVEINRIEELLDTIDLESDNRNFAEEHVADNREDEVTISVRSLLNPTRTGRMPHRFEDVETSWKSRFVVLMASERKLYIFDHEDSESPKHILNLTVCSVQAIHESFNSKSHSFQVTQQSMNGQRPNQHTFVAESMQDKTAWLGQLRELAECCTKCATSRIAFASSPYKIFRSLRLSVQEARDLSSTDLIRRSTDSYCIVHLHQSKVAKTCTKWNTLAPFWGDEFVFDELSPCSRSVKIVLCAQRNLQKDIELGYVSVDLDVVESRGGRFEEWIPLSPIDNEGNTLGAVRVIATITTDKVLSAQEYVNFEKIMFEPKTICARVLGQVLQSKEDSARIIVNGFTWRRMEVDLLCCLTMDEISSTDNINILFRGNSLATKAMDYYMKLVALPYLQNTLGDLMRIIYKSKESYEIDPTRLERPDDMPKNLKRLTNLVNAVWESIVQSLDRCPNELKEIFSAISSYSAERFVEKENARYLSVSGFIFLRFFCPAILNPKLFGMTSEHPDQQTSRTLTLVAKTLQNLANLADFGAKEPHMSVLNPFLKRNMDTMKMVIDRFSLPKTRAPSTALERLETDPQRDLAALAVLFIENRDALLAFHMKQAHPELDVLFSVLDTIQAILQIPPPTSSSVMKNENSPQISTRPSIVESSSPLRRQSNNHESSSPLTATLSRVFAGSSKSSTLKKVSSNGVLFTPNEERSPSEHLKTSGRSASRQSMVFADMPLPVETITLPAPAPLLPPTTTIDGMGEGSMSDDIFKEIRSKYLDMDSDTTSKTITPTADSTSRVRSQSARRPLPATPSNPSSAPSSPTKPSVENKNAVFTSFTRK